MRTLESLIKAKGGWKKISTSNKNTYSKMCEDLLNYIKRFCPRFENIYKADDEIKMLSLMNEVCMLAVDAYDENLKRIAPLCVVVATALNNACHDLQNIEDGKAIKNLEKSIKDLDSNGLSEINNYLSRGGLLRHVRGANTGFTWRDTPEGHEFWTKMLDYLRTPEMQSLRMFKDFISVHPECEKEIKEFCK